jgi:hypothetical protein
VERIHRHKYFYFAYSKGASREDLHAWTKDKGDFVAGTPIDIWDHLHSDNRKALIDQLGNEEQAKMATNDVILKTVAIHEITHIYQDVDLPFAFFECGAYYYQDAIMTANNWGGVQRAADDLMFRRGNFYQQQIEQYGDDVHRVFFGAKIPRRRKRQIVKPFTHQVTFDLFPGLEDFSFPPKK